jgi:DinB superfamily
MRNAWAMPIVADTKNWTWVLERPCPECGFEAARYPRESLATAIRDNVWSWPVVLERANVRERPNDFTWSALEYAAHVRDVLTVYQERLRLMIESEDPLFANWDQDATALAERYNEQNPAPISLDLTDAGVALAGTLETLDDAQWARVGRRSDGANFTVRSLVTYMVHDLVHHRWDVNR